MLLIRESVIGNEQKEKKTLYPIPPAFAFVLQYHLTSI